MSVSTSVFKCWRGTRHRTLSTQTRTIERLREANPYAKRSVSSLVSAAQDSRHLRKLHVCCMRSLHKQKEETNIYIYTHTVLFVVCSPYKWLSLLFQVLKRPSSSQSMGLPSKMFGSQVFLALKTCVGLQALCNLQSGGLWRMTP